MNYRKRILEFRSNISEQDVKDGEDVLRAYGVPEEKVQPLLAELCQKVFDLDIYEPEQEDDATA